MTAQIKRVTELPKQIHQLSELARADGHRNLIALIEEFGDGSNTFNKSGEALYAAFVGPILVGIGGLNRDPYTPDDLAGRVRRVFVAPHYRRTGVATALMKQIEDAARGTFPKLQLFTSSAEASRFYRSIGYRPIEGRPKVSHEKTLVEC